MEGCLSENVVAQFVSGGSPAHELASIEEHFDACSACRSLVLAMVREGARTPEAAPDLPERLDEYRLLGSIGHGAMGQSVGELLGDPVHQDRGEPGDNHTDKV